MQIFPIKLPLHTESHQMHMLYKVQLCTVGYVPGMLSRPQASVRLKNIVVIQGLQMEPAGSSFP
jgi:hypothetical protein